MSDEVTKPEETQPDTDLIQDTDIVDVPDIPLPDTSDQELDILDDFDSAFRVAIIGIGQGGSRIAETFYKMGYKRVCVVNTALQDLGGIDLPDDRKLAIDTHGAGKDPARAKAVFHKSESDIYDLMRRSFGPSFDWILVCAGAGGGTGGGIFLDTVNLSHELMRTLKLETDDKCRVGALVALPKNSEGVKPAANTFKLMKKVFPLAQGSENQKRLISPLIVIDNERIRQLYPRVPVTKHWGLANRSICSLFHLFNMISIKPSKFTSFDQADLETILESGILTFGATPVAKWEGLTDIAFALRDNLSKNILTAMSVDGAIAGGIVIAGQKILDRLPTANIEHGFEQMNRMMKPGSTLHQGIYPGGKETLVVYTVLGGLDIPKDRMLALEAVGQLRDWDGV